MGTHLGYSIYVLFVFHNSTAILTDMTIEQQMNACKFVLGDDYSK